MTLHRTARRGCGLLLLALLGILAGCGGAAESDDVPLAAAGPELAPTVLPAPAAGPAQDAPPRDVEPAVSLPDKPAVTAPGPAVPPDAIEPAAATPAAGAAPVPPAVRPAAASPPWSPVWAQTWAGAPTVRGRLSSPGFAECDPASSGAFWGWTYPDSLVAIGPVPVLATTGDRLVIDQVQAGGDGWAVLSGVAFDPSRGLRLTGTIELLADDGAWIGLALIQRHSHYREISLRWDGPRLLVQRYSPCEVTTLAQVEPGPHALALEYLAGVGWRYFVDGVLLHEEPGAVLDAPVHAGLFVVNVKAESTAHFVGGERAFVGPLRVEEGPPQ